VRDRRRDGHLQRAGWAVLRFSGREIKKDAGACAQIVAVRVQEARRRAGLEVFALAGGAALLVLWQALARRSGQ